MKQIKAIPKLVFDKHFTDKEFKYYDYACFISILDIDNNEQKFDKSIDNFLQVKMWDIEEDLFENGELKYEKPNDNELNDEFLGPTLFYRKYPDELHENFVNTALESLQSLIEANVLLRNKMGLIERTAYMVTGLLSDIRENTRWWKSEESVFHNPYYYFKLK